MRGSWHDGWVRLEVSNPLLPEQSPPHRGNRMALDNIGRRLQALYGEDAGIATEYHDQQFKARMFYRVGERAP